MKKTHVYGFNFLLILLALIVQPIHVSGFGAPPEVEEPISFETSVNPTYKHHFLLFFPNNKQLVFKPTIKIKGVNRSFKSVFVNGKKVELNSEGRFSKKLTLKKPGKNTVLFSFDTRSNKVEHFVRKIYWAIKPKDFRSQSLLTEKDLYFLNTRYVHNSQRKNKLKSPFTRAQLAYFSAQLKGSELTPINTSKFDDVQENGWASSAIHYVSNEQFLVEFPDGLFRPNKAVTKLEYIIALVRLFDLELEKASISLPFQDVDDTHWTRKFVQAAYKWGLIPPSTFLNPDKLITFGEFIYYAKRLRPVSMAIELEKDFNQGYEIKNKSLNTMMALLEKNLINEVDQDLNKSLGIDFPQQNHVIYDKAVTVSGATTPLSTFYIDDIAVRANSEGTFAIKVPLIVGKNKLTINNQNTLSLRRGTSPKGEDQQLIVWRLDTHNDLKNHWVRKTAAKLRFAKLLDDNSNFSPKEIMTRETFSRLASQLFELKPLKTNLRSFRDVQKSSKYFRAIKTMSDHNILKGNQKRQFLPKNKLSKLEAIIAATRLSKLTPLAPIQLVSVKLPYNDLPNSHWATDTVKLAYARGLLSKSSKLNPNKSITKAELVALLSKSPVIKRKLENIYSL